jgi:hypothetical protein
MRISFVFSLDKWQLVSLDYTATFLWLSQARIWISNAMCLFFLMFSKLKWGIVVHLVDIGWIDYTRCLNTLFIKYPCKNITYVLQCHACVNCSKMLYTCAFFFCVVLSNQKLLCESIVYCDFLLIILLIVGILIDNKAFVVVILMMKYMCQIS